MIFMDIKSIVNRITIVENQCHDIEFNVLCHGFISMDSAKLGGWETPLIIC